MSSKINGGKYHLQTFESLPHVTKNRSSCCGRRRGGSGCCPACLPPSLQVNSSVCSSNLATVSCSPVWLLSGTKVEAAEIPSAQHTFFASPKLYLTTTSSRRQRPRPPLYVMLCRNFAHICRSMGRKGGGGKGDGFVRWLFLRGPHPTIIHPFHL